MSNAQWRAYATVCCGLLAGCAGSSSSSPPLVHAKALESEHRGFKAETSRDYGKSLLHYQQALQLNRSVENTDGIAIDLVNLAVLYQRLGKDSDAQASVDEALSLPEVGDSIRSEAAYEKAKLCLKSSDFAQARTWVGRALSLDKDGRTESRLNLLGRIAFMEGHDEEVLRWASAALDANRDGLQIAEKANSLRLIASANGRKGNDAVAKAHYLQALRMDKEAGESEKIALDLMELGKLSLKTGNREEARLFFQRADQVIKNAGHDKNATQ